MDNLSRRFIDKHVIITGAGSGIGRGIAHRFAAEGAKVVVADIDREGGERVAEELLKSGAQSEYIPVDVTSEDSIKELVEKSVESFGPLHVAVSNAGISETESSALEISGEQWDKVYAVNTKGSFMFCRTCANEMIDNGTQGSIVNHLNNYGPFSKKYDRCLFFI